MAEEAQVIIVGAGPTGLAVAAYCHELSIPYTLLEREDCFASLWKKYTYDRLHLHIPKEYCQLPFMPFPDSYPTYVSKHDFINYIDDYVSTYKIKPVYHQLVEYALFDHVEGKWKVKARDLETNDHVVKEYWSRFLVVATGETCNAYIPKIEGLDGFKGEVLHSTEYKNGERFKGKKVLVVGCGNSGIGCGNSGMEIALDLANYGAITSIVIRSPMHIISRWMMYVGLLLLKYMRTEWVDKILIRMSKLIYGDLTRFHIHRPEERPYAMKFKYGKYSVVDVGTVGKIKSREIEVLPGIEIMKGEDSVVFENGKIYPYDAIVFCTGFKRATKAWLKGDDYLFNEDGIPKPSFPNHWKGENGLYCAEFSRKGFYGAAWDAQAQHITHDIKSLLS